MRIRTRSVLTAVAVSFGLYALLLLVMHGALPKEGRAVLPLVPADTVYKVRVTPYVSTFFFKVKNEFFKVKNFFFSIKNVFSPLETDEKTKKNVLLCTVVPQ